jgi:hypothetical protein
VKKILRPGFGIKTPRLHNDEITGNRFASERQTYQKYIFNKLLSLSSSSQVDMETIQNLSVNVESYVFNQHISNGRRNYEQAAQKLISNLDKIIPHNFFEVENDTQPLFKLIQNYDCSNNNKCEDLSKSFSIVLPLASPDSRDSSNDDDPTF